MNRSKLPIKNCYKCGKSFVQQRIKFCKIHNILSSEQNEISTICEKCKNFFCLICKDDHYIGNYLEKDYRIEGRYREHYICAKCDNRDEEYYADADNGLLN